MKVRDILVEHKQGYYRPGKFEAGDVHLVRISDITDEAHIDKNTTPMVSVDEAVLSSFSIKKNDFLFARTGGAGRFALVKEDIRGIFASYLIRFRFKSGYDPRFLRYYFLSDAFQFELKSTIHGGVNQNVHAENIKDCSVPTFSLPEQQRIIALLDETFAALTEVHAKAECNRSNAKEMLESVLRETFENGKNWEEKRLEECFRLKSGDVLTSKMMSDSGEFPVYGGNGIAGMHDRYNLSGDNVIIGRVGALCGNARHITENIWLTDNAFKLVDFNFEFNNKFLTYLLNFKNLRKFARQAAQPVISNSSLKDILLRFPKSIDEQRAIVDRLDALTEATMKLEAVYQSKVNAVEELRKSILQKAFEGSL